MLTREIGSCSGCSSGCGRIGLLDQIGESASNVVDYDIPQAGIGDWLQTLLQGANQAYGTYTQGRQARRLGVMPPAYNVPLPTPSGSAAGSSFTASGGASSPLAGSVAGIPMIAIVGLGAFLLLKGR